MELSSCRIVVVELQNQSFKNEEEATPKISGVSLLSQESVLQ